MKKEHLSYLRWLLPAALLGAGAYFSRVPIADFLAVACFAAAALLTVIFLLPMLHRHHPKTAQWIALALVTAVALAVILVTVTAARIGNAEAGTPETAVSYIVVLGAKVNGATPSDNLRSRIDAAYAYLTAHPDTVAVLSGGQGSDEEMTEAQCMRRELTGKGIDGERLWLEEKATSTWENICFSLDLIEEQTGQRPDTIGLVTSEFHLYRAGLFAADCGVNAVGIPGKTADSFEHIYYFLREIAGVWHYYLLGGLYHD